MASVCEYHADDPGSIIQILRLLVQNLRTPNNVLKRFKSWRMRTFKDILSVPQLFIFKLNHKYNLPLHLIIYNNDSVDVLPITSRCISDQVTKLPIRSRHDVSPIKSRSVPTKYVRSHDVFRTTYEMSDLIRIRIGSEGATDSSCVGFVLNMSKK